MDVLEPLNNARNGENRESADSTQDGGWSKLLVIAAITTTLGCALPAGYNIGVVNNPQTVIKEFCNESIELKYNVTLSQAEFDVVWSSVVSIFIVGGVVGSMCGGLLADRYGRKGSILISDVLGIIAAVCFILSKEITCVELLLIGRFIVGLSSGLTTAVVPMYLTELSPLRLRGAVGVLCPLGITIGVLLSQILGLQFILGTADGWHWLFALYALLIIATGFAIPIMPESPKYLFVVRGLEDNALKELERIRGPKCKNLQTEINALKLERRGQQEAGKWTVMAVLKDPKLRLPLILVVAMQGGQQLSGVNAVFYYSSEIFKSAGLPELQAQLGSLGAGVVNLAVAGLSVYTMHRFARRKMILGSCTGAALALCLLTISITYNKSSDWLTYIPIVAVLLYVFLYGLGLGPLPYFVGSELFEVGPRPVAMALGSMANWGGNFLVGMTFPSLNSAIGQYVFIFYILVVVCLIALLYFYFPETKGLEQHEVAGLMEHGFRSTVNSRSYQRNAA